MLSCRIVQWEGILPAYVIKYLALKYVRVVQGDSNSNYFVNISQAGVQTSVRGCNTAAMQEVAGSPLTRHNLHNLPLPQKSAMKLHRS